MALSSEFTQICIRASVEYLETYLRDGTIAREQLPISEFCYFMRDVPILARYQKCALLLNAGADANQRYGNGRTSLMNVCMFPSVDSILLCDLLIAYGADINAMSMYDGTALCIAAKRPGEYAAQLVLHLLQRGANPCIRNNFNLTTPLHATIGTQNPNCFIVCRCLLEYGANPNQQDWRGDICLHILAYRARNILPNALRELLLDFGADPTIRNNAGDLPGGLMPLLAKRKARHDRLKALLMTGRQQSASPLHIIDEAMIEIIAQLVHRIP